MTFLESAVVRTARQAHWWRPDEQVSHSLSDARLERRERARERARNRTGERHDS